MTIIVADTTCGLPRDLLRQRGIPFVPQVVIFGEESYHDDEQLNTATFLQKLKSSSTLPKTAAPEQVKAWLLLRRQAKPAELSARYRQPRRNSRN